MRRMFAIAMRRCCTGGARRQDETSAPPLSNVSPRPGSSTGERRRPCCVSTVDYFAYFDLENERERAAQQANPTAKGSNGFLCPGCGVLVPVGCPCPLPFGARPMPVPATLRCPPHARARYPSVPARLLVPRRAPTRPATPTSLCAPTRPATRSSACARSN